MGKVIGALLFVALVAVLIWFFFFKGGDGFSFNKKKNSDNNTTVSDTAKSETTTAEDKKQESAEITVSGNDYLYNNEKLTLDKLAAEISKLDKDAEITITSDDTAAKNTVDELTDKLEELGYNNFKKADK